MKYAAFLRGINVGGHNKIAMEALRDLFLALEFENAKTYINSGNVVFEAPETSDGELAAAIEKALEDEFSLSLKVMVRTTAELTEIVRNNPFAGEFENDKQLHVIFLTERLSPEKVDLLLSNNSEREKFAVRGRDLYYLLQESFAGSLLAKKYIDNKLKTPATARNWRTVNKILEL